LTQAKNDVVASQGKLSACSADLALQTADADTQRNRLAKQELDNTAALQAVTQSCTNQINKRELEVKTEEAALQTKLDQASETEYKKFSNFLNNARTGISQAMTTLDGALAATTQK